MIASAVLNFVGLWLYDAAKALFFSDLFLPHLLLLLLR